MVNKTKKKHREDTPTSPSNSDDDESETSDERRLRHKKDRRSSDGTSRREKEKKRERRRKRRERKEKEIEREKDRKRRKSRKKRVYNSESRSSSGSDSEELRGQLVKPEDVVKVMLKKFPNVGGDLKQLLQMIDDGQAVDIKGISERSLIKHLKKLFISLNLKENGDRVFLLPSNACPTLEIVGSLILAHSESKVQQIDDTNSEPPAAEVKQLSDDSNLSMPSPIDNSSPPRRRMIGPEMPSAELLAAAAKLTEAQAELRDAELEENTELFIGPPPPAVVAEAESANEAERFEEVTRIMGVEDDSPYDIVGVNHKMSAENIKKRYWKLSLLVHPDKCSHPQAHQAFIKLNKAFKELQDPEKRKLLDEKIKLKEEKEAFEVELKAMREAAQWRRSQGISMEGDDELLAEVEVKVARRDEWMTTLPPERKPGMSMHSTKFSMSSKEGRGDTSVWTDTPLDKAQKAKMNYLEAYNEAAALALNEEEKKNVSADADLVDKYNKAKRSKSLVQKHQEEVVTRSKKKSKQQQPEKEDWVGQHPWKPWDREKDIVAGRKSIKFDSDNMAQGLSSRFSSGNFQRNFL
ncbi:hypothetical protein JCGZ_03893 [Jatropha curcas]|uniref:J domain-containing protein n=1 Tax=Jatropha curcas TaxID=180498 RepID=A0A067LQ71_JATCU|nr:calponin homology domain-containing protein DDB_G0272472 [Jatropha curcas]KDP47085.1 hypothetical protein JCGZ_03893 [Jatropha curcas]